ASGALSGSGGSAVNTVQIKQLWVTLSFIPYILAGNLTPPTVGPEDSIVQLSAAAQGIPRMSTRRTNTLPEIRQGPTLMTAGPLQLRDLLRLESKYLCGPHGFTDPNAH